MKGKSKYNQKCLRRFFYSRSSRSKGRTNDAITAALSAGGCRRLREHVASVEARKTPSRAAQGLGFSVLAPPRKLWSGAHVAVAALFRRHDSPIRTPPTHLRLRPGPTTAARINSERRTIRADPLPIRAWEELQRGGGEGGTIARCRRGMGAYGSAARCRERRMPATGRSDGLWRGTRLQRKWREGRGGGVVVRRRRGMMTYGSATRRGEPRMPAMGEYR